MPRVRKCFGQETKKPAKGVQPKGGLSSADPSGTLLASLLTPQAVVVLRHINHIFC